MDNRWKSLTDIDQLTSILSESHQRPQLVFKHSTRCSISTMALNRLKGLSVGFFNRADFYYLDLIAFRNISNAIADNFHVYHESPQIILLKDGEAVYDASHLEITPESIEKEL
jgi:bacillithiol system protein YtxJ